MWNNAKIIFEQSELNSLFTFHVSLFTKLRITTYVVIAKASKWL